MLKVSNGIAVNKTWPQITLDEAGKESRLV